MEFAEEYSKEERTQINFEFQRLEGHHYLDHAGTTLYSEKQIESITSDFTKNLYCSPHTSKLTGDLIDQVRYKVLEFFNADPTKYDVIFTKNSTDGLKTLADSFDFQNGQFVHLRNCHTSVLGMRELVKTDYIKFINAKEFLAKDISSLKQSKTNGNSLMVYPAQCNYNGFKYPLEMIKEIHSIQTQNWFVCLDAASFVSTNHLDLSSFKPDFVTVSFYKIFGYPTGLGALIVSKRGGKVLRKKYYGGGTVKIAMSAKNFHQKRDNIYDQFEDGTVPFLSIISLLHGFNTIQRLIPGKNIKSSMDRISKQTFSLAKYLFNKMSKLKYRNGQKLIKFYNQTQFECRTTQGAIINFNVLHSDGRFVGYSEIVCMCEIHNIQIRTGCFCNPGACQTQLGLTDEEVIAQFNAGHVCGDSNDLIENVPTGSVRVSLGYMTKLENVEAFLEMLEKCYLGRVNIDIPSQLSSPLANKPVLEQICIYPLKSCAPFRIFSKWEITNRGLKYDRTWMIVNCNGLAVTQKNTTRLCLIQPVINERRNVIRISFPNLNPIEIPLNCDNSEDLRNGNICSSKVCGDRVQGFDCGNEVADWLEQALDIPGVRLLKQTDFEKRTFKKDISNNEISLANQAQFLLISIPSVKWLMSHVNDYLLDMTCDEFVSGIVDRFRGNLIISSNEPIKEQEWKQLDICNIKFKNDGPCTRCQMICIDQKTGEKTTEPLRTIGKLFEGKMRFGVYFSQFGESKEKKFISCGAAVNFEL